MSTVPPIDQSEVPYPPAIPKNWGGLFNSLRREAPGQTGKAAVGERCTVIEGTIPDGLNGDFIASGPVMFTILGAPVNSWFDGQGGVHRVRINGQKVHQWSRLVETQDYKDEEASGVITVNHFNSNAPLVVPFSGARTFNTSNTQCMMWNDRLFSLYEGGLPTELDVQTLESKGESTFDGLLNESEHFSAHFHWHPRTKTIFNYGLLPHLHLKARRNCKGLELETTQLQLFGFREDGTAGTWAKVDLPAYPWLHDFILSDRYAIFFIPPVQVDLGRMMEDMGTLADNYYQDEDGRTRLIIVDLDDPKRITNVLLDKSLTVPTGSFWQWHFANAYEDGEHLHVDFILYDDYETHVKDFVMSIHKKRYPATVQPSRLVRATMKLRDPATVLEEDETAVDPASFQLSTIADISSEFCRVSPAALTSNTYRYVYMGAHSSVYASYNCLWDTLCKVDVRDKTAQRYSLGAEQIPSEPIFVPRPDSKAEDDGWILCMVYDGSRDRSYLAILDSAQIPTGTQAVDDPAPPVPVPEEAWVARVWMPVTVPITFHRIFTGIGGGWPVNAG